MADNYFFARARHKPVPNPASKAVTLRLDPHAYELLKAHASGNNLGQFLSRLVFEYVAREEERARCKAEVAARELETGESLHRE